MIETKWWDSLIVNLKYGDGKLELRLGVFCLLVVVVVVWKIVRALMNRSGGE